jgi:hypothetical protein
MIIITNNGSKFLYLINNNIIKIIKIILEKILLKIKKKKTLKNLKKNKVIYKYDYNI